MTKNLLNIIQKTDAAEVASDISETLSAHIEQNDKILLLLSGGSAIVVATNLSLNLNTNVSIALLDERYGDPMHLDSNAKQLMDAGFDMQNAKTITVLEGDSIQETTDRFSRDLIEAKESADLVVAIAGIGPDGHTSGVLPHTVGVSSEKSVEHYDGGTYQRITTTLTFIKEIDHTFIYAVGENKWPAIKQMLEPGPLEDIPARVYTEAKAVTLYTDYKGEI